MEIILQRKSGFTTDPETGCVRGYNDYEQCRTNYFLKQQNQILKNQQGVSNNGDGDGDSQVMGTTTEAQVQGQTNNNLAAVEAATSGFSLSLAYALILVAVVITTVIVTKYFTKKKDN